MLNGGSHRSAEITVCTELSLSLGSLDAEFMAAIRVIQFDLSALGERKSLSGSLMCLYF